MSNYPVLEMDMRKDSLRIVLIHEDETRIEAVIPTREMVDSFIVGLAQEWQKFQDDTPGYDHTAHIPWRIYAGSLLSHQSEEEG